MNETKQNEQLGRSPSSSLTDSACFQPYISSWKAAPACLPPGWLSGYFVQACTENCMDLDQCQGTACLFKSLVNRVSYL